MPPGPAHLARPRIACNKRRTVLVVPTG
jgi:hypothetical protein